MPPEDIEEEHLVYHLLFRKLLELQNLEMYLSRSVYSGSGLLQECVIWTIQSRTCSQKSKTGPLSFPQEGFYI